MVTVRLVAFEKMFEMLVVLDYPMLHSSFQGQWSICSGNDFYAPNLEEVEGSYWFGPVRPSVCP